jgi:HEAT repeat protein
MTSPAIDLEQLKRDLASGDAGVRGSAVNRLFAQVQQDPTVHAQALEIYHAMLRSPRDPFDVTSGIRGIEHIAGTAQGRQLRLAMFDNPRAELVRAVVGTITDPSYVPELVALLHRRTEEAIRVMVIRVLGRLRDPAALPAIVQYLPNPKLRPDAVEALGDLGDARAIPYLQGLLNDDTEAWEIDNHGPMLRVRNLVRTALAQLR